MKVLQPVIWSKGTLLTPQHLQLHDRFVESVLHFHTEALHFKPWGFSELRLDHEALGKGRLVILRAQGIFSDGLLFDAPDSDASPEPKALSAYFTPDQDTVNVYLAVPHHLDRGLNVALMPSNAATRYVAQTQLVRDENSGTSEKPVQVAKKNLRILAEGDPLQGNSILKIGSVKKTAAGTLELDPHVVPPLIHFGANEYLTSILRRLLEILSAKFAELSGARRQRTQSLADFTASDVGNFWLLYTINTHLPRFRHLFEVQGVHPEQVYALLLSLAGALTTFSNTIRARDLPLYDHENLGSCFKELDEKTRLLLETVVPSNYVSLPLKLVQPSIYATALAEDRFFVNTRMYLAISAETDEPSMITKVPQLVKMCSGSHIENLIRQALPGVKLTRLAAPPSPVPMKLNYQYFSLNQSGPAWESILKARNVAAYVPGDFPNPQMELVIILPEKS